VITGETDEVDDSRYVNLCCPVAPPPTQHNLFVLNANHSWFLSLYYSNDYRALVYSLSNYIIRKFHSSFLLLESLILLVPDLCRTSKFVNFSVQIVFCIFVKSLLQVSPSLASTSFEITRGSQPYIRIDHSSIS